MKSLLLTITLLMGTTSFAQDEAQCADHAVKAAVQKNYKQYNASTNSCGIKPLNVGEFLETYLVCVSDETDPTEYIVVIDPRGGKCKVKFLDSATESSTPNFDNSTLYIKDIEGAIQCSQDPADGILNCKKPVQHKEPTQEELNAKDVCYKPLEAKLFADVNAKGEWGFEFLAAISKANAYEYLQEAPGDEVSAKDLASAKKLIDSDSTLTYLLGWTAPGNAGSSVIIAEKATCTEKISYVVGSEE